jgi:hypothetical protein
VFGQDRDKDDDRLSAKAYHTAKKKAFEEAQQQQSPGTPEQRRRILDEI